MAAKPKSRQAPAPQPKKLPILGILAGVVGIALIVAIAISIAGSESKQNVAVEVGSPTVSGALPAFAAGGADAAVGSPIPEVSGTNFDGEAVTIGPGRGPAGIVFLAHWCGFCQEEVPAIQEWLDGGATPAAAIYTVATSIDELRPNYPPWSWLAREGWTSPVLVDDAFGSVMRGFGGSSFPYWVFFDGDGNVVARAEGAQGVDNVAALLELAATS